MRVRWNGLDAMALTLVLAFGMAMPLRAAELFYMDHDTLTAKYVGAVGPLVLSGDIVPGDYDRLLTKIAQSEDRFLEQNQLILASERGDVAEALRIGKLVKALKSEVAVDPLAGKCVGACFLIYVAASQRATDGPDLIGAQRLPGTDAFLRENSVPAALVAELSRHTTDVYRLTEQDEQSLGSRSPAFLQYLKTQCAWDETVEREAYSGKRALSELSPLLACRARVTRIDARKALASALAEKAAGRSSLRH